MNPQDIKTNPTPLPEGPDSQLRRDYAKLNKLKNIITNPGSVTDVPSTIFAILKFGRKYAPDGYEDIYEYYEALHLKLYKMIVEEEDLPINPLIKLDDGYYEVERTLVESLEPSASAL